MTQAFPMRSVRRLAFSGIVTAALLGACGSAASEAPARSDGRAPDSIPLMRGLNLAGGEFAPERAPGVVDRDYVYPTAEVAAPFLKAGMDTVRLPVLWERIQPDPMSPLSDVEMKRIDASLDALKGFRAVIIDVHNYARYKGVRLDQDPSGAAKLADLWTRLANRYKARPDIVFGIMNEPYDIGAGDWRGIVDPVVAAIRNTGAKNLLLISGTRWSGAHSWLAGGPDSNGAAFADFTDPGDHFLFELHQYLDTDSSGTKPTCVDAGLGADRLRDVTRWLRDRRVGAVLGEFGGGQGADCLAGLEAMLAYTDANADVWRGWTYWAGGAWWGDYPLSIQPDARGDKPQMRVLTNHLKR